MKKLFTLLMALVMVLSCTSFAAAAEKVEIEYWFGLGGNLGQLFLDLIDEYNASQDKVFVKGVQFPDYATNAQNYQAALAANKPPVAMHTQILQVTKFEKYFEPLNEYYKDPEFKAEEILPGCLSCMYGGDGETIVGVPLFATTQLMYYRKDFFEGYDIAETFATWQNLQKACEEIVAKYAAEGKTMIGWEPMWHGYNWTDAVQSAGGSVFTDATCREVNFLTQEWIDVMNYFADNFKSGLMTMNYGGTGWEYWYANIDDVMQGRAGGYTGSAGDQGDLDFSIVGAVAQPGFGDHRSSPSTDAHLAVISKSVSQEEKDAAWDFFKFLSSPASQGKISRTGGYVVTRSSCLEDPDFAAFVAENPHVLATIDAVNMAQKQWLDITGGYIETAYYDMVDRILLEGDDVLESLEICQEEAQAALDEYWSNQE